MSFRVDSSRELGSGHLVRCLTLANEVRRRGAAVSFISREAPGHLIDRLEREGHEVARLPAQATDDAAETLAQFGGDSADWLVVDHYALDRAWERALRRAARRILVIEDLPERAHDCDAFVDQNWYGPRSERRHAGRVPAQCVSLLGPRYALLQPQYAAARQGRTPREGAPRRVLLYFGASDLTNETAKALRALCAKEFAPLHVDVVVGANHPDKRGVKAQAAARPATTFHEELPSLAELMARADIAIGAGGATTWERICLGLPALVTTLAPNQEALSAALDEAGWVRLVGRAGQATSEDYRRALAAYAGRQIEREPLVDGFGARRVAELLVPSSSDALTLRRAREADAHLFYEWRTDPQARAMSRTEGPASWAEHRNWFERKLRDADAALYVGEADGLPIGQVRLDFRADGAQLSYSVDAFARGRGWGERMIREVLRTDARARAAGVVAEVKPDNAASRKVFARLGWAEGGLRDGMIVFRFKGIPQ